jgi:hypothetical protein
MTDFAKELVDKLPVCDFECESDYISLCDIVPTGIETPWTFFLVKTYNPESRTSNPPWATIVGLADSPCPGKEVVLDEQTVRAATLAYLRSRLDAGMPEEEAAKLVDGSYTDAEIADAILQFALYGEVVYS